MPRPMPLCAAWGCGIGAIPLLKETSNGDRAAGLARAALLLQRQAGLVRMPSRPPRHRRPDRRMRMNASPASEQLAGLVAFGDIGSIDEVLIEIQKIPYQSGWRSQAAALAFSQPTSHQCASASS